MRLRQGGILNTVAVCRTIMKRIWPKWHGSKQLTGLRNSKCSSALTTLFWIGILTYPHALLAQHTTLKRSIVTQQTTGDKGGDLYGLYYADCDEEPDCPRLVISSDGKPIPPKVNDPCAPTHPGLHVGQRLFPFAWSRFSAQEFSFRTIRVDRASYSFKGRFGREDVDVISDVPYLEGVLTLTRNGRVLLKKRVHFGHAVIL